MTLQIENVEHACNLIARQIQEIYTDLTLHFIIHSKGQLKESTALSEHEIIRHPAGETAQAILQRAPKTDHSSFLGMAVATQKTMLGFSSKDSVLGLFNVNIDDYADVREAKTHIYHLAWHAIDLMSIRQRPEHRRKFRSGPMIPKRSPTNLAKANLQADVFAAVMSGLHGEAETITLLAQNRGRTSLLPVAHQRAEDFPFIIAMEASEFVYSELERNKIPRSKYIETAKQLSLEVGITFDEASIRQWWAFAQPAQDMAWRGHSDQEILGAAVFTSEDPYVRATGYLVSEVTGITPRRLNERDGTYNSFANQKKNQMLHREIMEETFEGAIMIGLEEESGQALLNAANAQNEELTEGKILGWCASALQSAAHAFEQAVMAGAQPGEAARTHFEGEVMKVGWDSIKELGDNIVDQRRKGYALTMGHIAEICNENPAFAPILGALKITMNDPSYIQKLESANDLSIEPVAPAPQGPAPTAAPKGPAPKGPAPSAPVPQTPAVFAKAPGMGANKSHLIRQRMLQQQKMREESQGSDDTTKH